MVFEVKATPLVRITFIPSGDIIYIPIGDPSEWTVVDLSMFALLPITGVDTIIIGSGSSSQWKLSQLCGRACKGVLQTTPSSPTNATTLISTQTPTTSSTQSTTTPTTHTTTTPTTTTTQTTTTLTSATVPTTATTQIATTPTTTTAQTPTTPTTVICEPTSLEDTNVFEYSSNDTALDVGRVLCGRALILRLAAVAVLEIRCADGQQFTLLIMVFEVKATPLVQVAFMPSGDIIDIPIANPGEWTVVDLSTFTVLPIAGIDKIIIGSGSSSQWKLSQMCGEACKASTTTTRQSTTTPSTTTTQSTTTPTTTTPTVIVPCEPGSLDDTSVFQFSSNNPALDVQRAVCGGALILRLDAADMLQISCVDDQLFRLLSMTFEVKSTPDVQITFIPSGYIIDIPIMDPGEWTMIDLFNFTSLPIVGIDMIMFGSGASGQWKLREVCGRACKGGDQSIISTEPPNANDPRCNNIPGYIFKEINFGSTDGIELRLVDAALVDQSAMGPLENALLGSGLQLTILPEDLYRIELDSTQFTDAILLGFCMTFTGSQRFMLVSEGNELFTFSMTRLDKDAVHSVCVSDSPDFPGPLSLAGVTALQIHGANRFTWQLSEVSASLCVMPAN